MTSSYVDDKSTGSKFIVLLVEDDHLLSVVMSLELKEVKGITLKTTRNGVQAYEMIKELKPGLVILDVSLPGLNAFQIVEKLRVDPEFFQQPLIVQTSHALSQGELVALTLGPTKFVDKSQAAQSLARIVSEFISELPNQDPKFSTR